ncbi:MAG: ABC transporter permease [Oscillospiraceae bacterium]|nr:ABC transporter permease [Oscillospiraceae bacterium]
MKTKAKVKKQKNRGAAYDIWRSLRSNKIAVVCMCIIGVFVLISVLADVLFNYETQVIAQDIMNDLQSPSKDHWFGTDALGRDYFARMLYATRITLIISFSSVFIATALSIVIGGISAYCGGIVDTIIMRILDVFLAVPSTLLIICIVVALGNETVYIILALVVYLLPSLVRTVRSELMINMENEYVEAARSVGAGPFRIMLIHLLPNSFGAIMVRCTMSFALCILSTACIGYLGIGVRAPAPEWGRMLSEAQEYMRLHPYLITIPGFFIMISSTAFNLLGDALQDAMDPRLRGYRKMKKKVFARRKK